MPTSPFAFAFAGCALAASFALARDTEHASGTPIEGATTPASATADSADVPMREAADNVVTYTLRARLDPVHHTVQGDGTITWKNTSRVAASELWFHLYLNAFKNQRSVFLREPVGRFRGAGLPTDWGTIDVKQLAWVDPDGSETDLWAAAELKRPGDDDETDARVPLPRPVAPGETITLRVSFEDKLPSIVERTGYSGTFHAVAQWFPKLARLEPDGRWAHFPFHHLGEFYADFGTFDVTLDVPEAFTIAATGQVASSSIEAGRRIERRIQSEVHDFAWFAWDQFESMSETIDGVAVTLLHPRGYRVVARRQLAALRAAIPHFGARYGRYPYPILTVVHPPERAFEAGGMEYPTLITTGGAWYGPPGVMSPEIVAVHEFGHQYFYGLLASDEVTWPFLDEGLNSFAEQLALSEMRGPGSLVDLFGLRISDTAAQAVLGNLSAQDERVAKPAFAFESGTRYGHLVYQRTASLLETLRRVYGDARFAATMATYARRHRFSHPTPDDLIATFRETLGDGVASTLHVGLFERGWVDYEVTSVQSSREVEPAGIFDRGGKRETVRAAAADGSYVGSVLVTRRGTLTFPVDIELVLDDGARTRVRWEGDGETLRVPYRGAVPLRGAVVDPDRAILVDERRTNDFASVGGGGGGAKRSAERLFYWVELLVQAVSP
jgi:hypothetical protein